MQKNNGVKTFMSDGVKINDASLTKEDMHKIDCIIDSTKKRDDENTIL
jgi:hypothetical protein